MTTPFPRRKLNITTALPHQNHYTLALNREYAQIAFDEVRAPGNKGKWRSDVFKTDSTLPMDVEVGTGNGTYFAHHAKTYPHRLLVGLELKYKPLIQSIRRARNEGCKNAAVARFHAFNVDELFSEERSTMFSFISQILGHLRENLRIVLSVKRI